jgi:hypothetical protein
MIEMEFDELCVEVDRLDELCDKLISDFDKTWFTEENLETIKSKSATFGFDEYEKSKKESCQPHLDKLVELSRQKRFTMPYELSDIPSYGDVMSLDNFIENVEDGGFIDYDGHGSYVIDGKMTNVNVFASDVENKLIRTEFDTMIWFNR